MLYIFLVLTRRQVNVMRVKIKSNSLSYYDSFPIRNNITREKLIIYE